MPEDRLTADLNHWFGFDTGFFADPGAETTGENDGFHNKNELSELVENVLIFMAMN